MSRTSTSTTKVMRETKSSKSEVNKVKKLHDESLDEFHQSVKKVELPMFDGGDPAGRIARAGVFSHMQGSSTDVHSMIDASTDLTWKQLKQKLLEQYGGIGGGTSSSNSRARPSNKMEV